MLRRRESEALIECWICGCCRPDVGELHSTFPSRSQWSTTIVHPRPEGCEDFYRFFVERQYRIWSVSQNDLHADVDGVIDLVKARLTSLRAVMTMLKLSMSVYPPGAWLTRAELPVDENSPDPKATRLESWNLRSGLSSWTWRVISELRDADEEACTSPLRRSRLSTDSRKLNVQQH